MSILRIIRWLCGYVSVKLSGDNAAAFLNFCLQNKVSVWRVTKLGDDILVNMSLSDYKCIRSLRHRFGHIIHISHVAFIGLPKKILFINKRKSLAVGVAVFCTVLFAFSQFIWQIEIVGNKKISEKTIVDAYTELGVHSGMPRFELDSYALRDRLPLLIRDISWCSFNIEGTKLTVNITEVNEYDKTGKNEYSNLVAVTDGIIKNIDIISGNKIVDVGTVVSKGDVLISGAPELNSQQFTYSEGKVFAETSKTVTVTLPKIKTVAKMSGNVSERTVVDFFGFKIPFYLDSVHHEYISELVTNNVRFVDGELPIKIIKRRFIEVEYENAERSQEEVINDATAKLLEEIKNHQIIELQILDKIYSEDENNYIIKFECRCIEDIAQVQKINVAS